MILTELQRQLALSLAANPQAKMVSLPVSTVRALIQDLSSASAINGLVDTLKKPARQGKRAAERAEEPHSVRRKLLRDLPAFSDLSTRARNILRDESIHTIAQFQEYSESDWLRLPRMGVKTLEELKAWAKKVGVAHGTN